MKTFNITDEELYKKFKAQCALNEESMSEAVQKFMAEYIKE